MYFLISRWRNKLRLLTSSLQVLLVLVAQTLCLSACRSGAPQDGSAASIDGSVESSGWSSRPWDLSFGIPSCISGKLIFDTTGADAFFTVPANCTSIKATMWGAGGGGSFFAGGAGGYATGILEVTPGEILTIKVGGGAPGAEDGAGGGGRSAVLRGATEIFTAGGGGGASHQLTGGAGGGLLGEAGAGASAGGGGTQSAGGSGLAAGSAFQGGHSDSGYPGSGRTSAGGWPNGGNGGHISDVSKGGGGGDGYFGGGAGSDTDGSSGGGGSSYLGAATFAITQPGSEASLQSGFGPTPYTNDPDYVRGVAVGGAPANYQYLPGGNGGIGRVVIHW